MTLSQIKKALYDLSPEEREELKRAIERLAEEEAWDRQIEADAGAGRLDSILKAAKAEFAAGKTRGLPT